MSAAILSLCVGALMHLAHPSLAPRFVASASETSPDPVAVAARPTAWRVDAGAGVFREAWDFNRGTESLVGVFVGLDHEVWRGVAIRGEVMALRVVQERQDAWLRGWTLGTRMRWGSRALRPFVDVAIGISDATTPVPPDGTPFNYLALIGAGFERRIGPTGATVTGRWLHASNNGREGRHLNPDIQSLGAILSVGWEH